MRKTTPLVSVILVTYNRVNLLPDAIRSVLNQTYSNFELIIIDDGSRDGTPELVASFDDQRIRYYYLAHTGIISRNRNIGISKSRGEYLAIIDSDDIWSKCKIDVQIEALIKKPNCFSVCQVITTTNSSLTTAYNKQFSKLPSKNSFQTQRVFEDILFNRISYYPSTLLFRKDFLEVVGSFDETYIISEMEFIGRMSLHYDVIYFPEAMAIIRKHGKNVTTRSQGSLFDEKFLFVRKMFNREVINKKKFDQAMVAHYLAYTKLATISNIEFWGAIKKCFSAYNKPIICVKLIVIILQRLKYRLTNIMTVG